MMTTMAKIAKIRELYWTEGSVGFAPSRQLFDKHLADKKLDTGAHLGPDNMTVPARFEDVGWKGWIEKRDEKPAPAVTVPGQ